VNKRPVARAENGNHAPVVKSTGTPGEVCLLAGVEELQLDRSSSLVMLKYHSVDNAMENAMGNFTFE
jgi:hypothetical protein